MKNWRSKVTIKIIKTDHEFNKKLPMMFPYFYAKIYNSDGARNSD